MAQVTNHHQLAICQEQLANLEKTQFQTPKSNVQKRMVLADRIRSVKDRINKLGILGSLKMAIVIVNMPKPSPEFSDWTIRKTFTYFYHDLDDRSIETKIRAPYIGSKAIIISISILEIPLGVKLDSSFENNILSWSISS